MLAAYGGGAGRDFQRRPAQTVRSPAWALMGQARGVMVDGPKAEAASGREWQGAQSGPGAAELVSPGPALGEMQGEAACLGGEAYGQGEEARLEGTGGDQLLSQAGACGPEGQAVFLMCNS